MTRHRIEQAIVTGFGFLAGTILAVCITPGDVFLWIVAGIVLAVFTRAFFICDFGGELLWPFHRQPHDTKKNPVAPQH